MGYNQSGEWNLDPSRALYPAPEVPWGRPAPAAGPDADAEEDDWWGVLGFCHALRAESADEPLAARPDDVGDWGYGMHAI